MGVVGVARVAIPCTSVQTRDSLSQSSDIGCAVNNSVFVSKMPACAVITCRNRSDHFNSSNSGVTYHRYVIHATVYQVGIITNKSNDEIANMTGNQEALSFYHSNGSAVDLSGVPAPLLTNVTAQSAVAVGPVPGRPGASSAIASPLDVLEPFISGKKSSTVKRSENLLQPLSEKSLEEERHAKECCVYASLFRRSARNSSDAPAIKVVKETSLIPPEVGLKSIGLSDLIGLNTSVASIPLPIPNTSVVRYAKISTLVKAP